MKPFRIIAGLGLFLLYFGQVKAQMPGYQLRFSRVIDTVLVADLTTCSSLVNSGVFGTPITVPAGKVWKVAAIGPLRTNFSFYSFYTTSCSSSGSAVGARVGTEIYDGGAFTEFISSVEYTNSSTTNYSNTEGTVWLRAGTVIRAAIYSRSTSNTYGISASVSSPYRVSQFLSIIEFELIP